MSSYTSIFRAGWTERIIFQLTHDGEVFDLTGMTIGLTGRDTAGNVVTFTTVGIVDAATSKVYFDPAEDDLTTDNQPLRLRWSVTDSQPRTAWFPRAAPMVWQIENP